MKRALSRIIILLFLASILSACVTAKVAGPPRRFFWPPEPDVPRIEWIAAYNSDLDIKEKNFMSAVVGDDTNIQFQRPVLAAGDGEGRIVITDQELGQAIMFDLNHRKAFPLGGDVEAASFKQPSGVTVDQEGNFYIADSSLRKVFVVNAQNSIIRVMDLSMHVKSIGSMVIDRARATLIVPDSQGSKIVKFSLDGKLLATIDGKGYFSFPNAVAVASDASIFIADSFNATILHYSADGKYMAAIGRRGDSPGNLTLVTGVAVDSEDHIYATDGRLHNVTIFDKDGNTLLVVGAQHSVSSGNIGRGGFQIPQGISIDKNDRIYVADSFNKRIQVFQYLNKRYLADHPLTQARP
jgi:sugar lactone lactonase YvrE